MMLTVSKRLEFSASRRLFDANLSAAENIARYGEESTARYGTGRNYVAYFVFAGEADPETGMLINISEIKERAGVVIADGFDHKFLNDDNPAFAERVPTAENIARQLFRETEPLFRDSRAKLAACHLCETEDRSATFYRSGVSEANLWFAFSAARQTMSPHLSEDENARLFGAAASPFGHGHNYRVRLTARSDGEPPLIDGELMRAVAALRDELDHKNLNHEVAALRGRPVTTESLAAFIHEKTVAAAAVHRVRVHERDDFFAEHWSSGDYYVGMRQHFSAAHRLHVRTLADAANAELFGKCNNPRGHGHRYMVEATLGGVYDARSGTLTDFGAFRGAMSDSLEHWRDKHLDLETEDFRAKPSTGENIVQALWPKLNGRLDDRLVRLRLWETANNRFTLRRAAE